jgi:hypothetical protein
VIQASVAYQRSVACCEAKFGLRAPVVDVPRVKHDFELQLWLVIRSPVAFFYNQLTMP